MITATERFPHGQRENRLVSGPNILCLCGLSGLLTKQASGAAEQAEVKGRISRLEGRLDAPGGARVPSKPRGGNQGCQTLTS